MVRAQSETLTVEARGHPWTHRESLKEEVHNRHYKGFPWIWVDFHELYRRGADEFGNVEIY